MSINEKMTAIADAIRSKTGKTGSLTLDSMVTEINGIEAEPTLQSKTVSPSTSSQTVTPDGGYDGLDTVIVNAMPTATQATPSITINSSGLITASATQTAGYVAAGTKSATKQLTTQAAKTVTPSTSSQTAVASGRYTTGAVTVAAIPISYVKPTTKKAATTYTPTTSNQTIAAGTYCSGIQTIKGDSNLVAENIKNGVSIFGVNGTHSGSSGGVAVETCEVSCNVLKGYLTYVTVDASNNIVSAYKVSSSSSGNTIRLTNVVCGTCVTFTSTSSLDAMNTICNNAELLYSSTYGRLIRITAATGETSSFSIWQLGGGYD